MLRSSGRFARRSRLSYSTTRRVGPIPSTYAFSDRTRRLAFTRYTSPTSTPARRARLSTWARALLVAGSGVNLLKSGATTTGASQTKTAAIAPTATVPGSHQRLPKRRTSPINSAPPAAASTAPIAVDFPVSASHEPNDWVEIP